MHYEGHSVVGIEGVEQPIKDFFKENNLEPIIEKLRWATLYKVRYGDKIFSLYKYANQDIT